MPAHRVGLPMQTAQGWTRSHLCSNGLTITIGSWMSSSTTCDHAAAAAAGCAARRALSMDGSVRHDEHGGCSLISARREHMSQVAERLTFSFCTVNLAGAIRGQLDVLWDCCVERASGPAEADQWWTWLENVRIKSQTALDLDATRYLFTRACIASEQLSLYRVLVPRIPLQMDQLEGWPLFAQHEGALRSWAAPVWLSNAMEVAPALSTSGGQARGQSIDAAAPFIANRAGSAQAQQRRRL